jgi:hypothetical protein
MCGPNNQRPRSAHHGEAELPVPEQAGLDIGFERALTDWIMKRCIRNLRQLAGAIEAFALENKKRPTDPVTFNDLKPYLRGTLVCRAGGTSIQDSYRVTDCQSPPTCISPGGGAAHGHVLDR